MTGRNEGAVDLYKRALEIDPDYPLAHNQLGLTYLELGDEISAVRHIKKAVELEPLSVIFRLSLASVYERTGDKKGALKEYLEIKKISPKNEAALKKLEELDIPR